MRENEMLDSLEQMNDAVAQSDSLDAGVQANEQLAQLQQQWLARTAEENLELLNGESAKTGVYSFSYVSSPGAVPEIPGMNKVSYQVPGDTGDGYYVGYESYEQTYERAKDAYQEALASGDPSVEAEEQFAQATETYNQQKEAYSTYLEEHPGSPDYLQSGNPVESYVSFDSAYISGQELHEKEVAEAAYDVDMDSVDKVMESGKEGAVLVDTAAVSGAYAQEYQEANGAVEDAQQYAVRVSETVPESSIRGMQNYQSVMGTEIPDVTAEAGTDEYGQQLVARMQAIDADMKASNPEYESTFPEHMQYLPEGENPQAIPGMTLVVGQIEGVDGYYIGYESYDETYQRSLDALDAKSAELESSSLSESELVEQQEALSTGYNTANSLYDMQKAQYEGYVESHPGNDFLSKDNAVEAYNEYQDAQPMQQKIQDMIGGFTLKEFLENAKEKIDEWLTAVGMKAAGKDPGMTEEQAAQTSADYWSKRAALESDNPDVQTKAVEAAMQNEELGAAQATADVSTGNRFRDIVQSEMGTQESYQPINDMSSVETEKTYGSTGNQMLDELSAGSTQTVDSMVMAMPDAVLMEEESYGMDAFPYETAYGVPSPQPQSSQTLDRSASLAALEERLAKGAAQQQAEGPDFGPRFGR